MSIQSSLHLAPLVSLGESAVTGIDDFVRYSTGTSPLTAALHVSVLSYFPHLEDATFLPGKKGGMLRVPSYLRFHSFALEECSQIVFQMTGPLRQKMTITTQTGRYVSVHTFLFSGLRVPAVLGLGSHEKLLT